MRPHSDDDEDETFYYRYTTPSNPNPTSSTSSTTPTPSSKPRNTLAPSKSTVYISNIDYTLTNSDLVTIFSTFGKVARVTVLKDRITRQSRGVAFVLFVSRDDAVSAAHQMNGKILNGRKITASIAADNGRAPEFIRRREYKDKSRCYECGTEGHLSYECPRNQLGPRERPVPKKPRRGGGGGGGFKERKGGGEGEDDEVEGSEVFDEENWASVVDNEADQRLLMREEGVEERRKGKKTAKKSSYFSDESGGEED